MTAVVRAVDTEEATAAEVNTEGGTEVEVTIEASTEENIEETTAEDSGEEAISEAGAEEGALIITASSMILLEGRAVVLAEGTTAAVTAAILPHQCRPP